MIVSCSRRTDIPAFYSEWFMNRLRDGYVCVRNPYNHNQISKIYLSREVVDCIVFWTKNSGPMMKDLDEIHELGYEYYFHFTITPYQTDIEPGLKDKKESVKNFIRLSEKIGKEKVILRYDPILFTPKYTIDYHEKAFEKLCKQVGMHTKKVVISFVDHYRKNHKKLIEADILEPEENQVRDLSVRLVKIASQYGLYLETCAEKYDLADLGIKHGACIDGSYIAELIGSKLINENRKDGNRALCGCMESIDIGQYDTCLHACTYCYANISDRLAKQNNGEHDPKSDILIGRIGRENITVRKGNISFRKDKDLCQQALL